MWSAFFKGETRPSLSFNLTLVAISIAALIAFIVTLLQGIQSVGVIWDNYTPMTPSFLSLVSFLWCFFFLIWANLFPRHNSRTGVWLWFLTAIVWCFCGFASMIAFATMPGDGLSAGLSFLFWLIPGFLVAVQTNAIRVNQSFSGSAKPCCSSGECCTVACWLMILAMPVLMFIAAITVAITNQTISSSLDVGRFTPMGTIYQLSTNLPGDSSPKTIRMHLACFGPKSTSNTTWILEHGGGSNSNSLKYLADRLAAVGYRACVYDRLGYGWTPSFIVKDNASRFDSDAVLLTRLLAAANEQGPFVCVGHSAGAEKCLRFAALTNSQVRGIAFLDGYPDYVRAASIGLFQPNYALVGATKLFAFLLGPTGFTRGFVGSTPAGYVPQEWAKANTALYAQNRFWTSQMADVVGDIGSGVEAYAYRSLNGTQDSTSGLVTYGRTLNITIAVFPAASTVSPLDCVAVPKDFCCNSGKGTSDCDKAIAERGKYLNQSLLYANTLGVQPGIHVIAPTGSDHGFPYTLPYADWLVGVLLQNFTRSF